MTFPKSNIGQLDAGESRDTRTRPCAHRMLVTVDKQPVSTWCVLADGHAGEHESPVRSAPRGNEFGPGDAIKRGWGR